MAITLLSLQTRVRTRFEQDSSVRLDDDRLNEAINEGIEELAEATEYYEQNEAVTQLGGRTYYDIRGILSPNALKITSIFSSTSNRWLDPVSIRELAEDDFEETQGDPQKWFMRGLFHLGIYPYPAAGGGTLTIYYKALPAELSSSSDSPAGLPMDYSEAVEEYALYELHAQEGQTDPALQHWQNYKELEATLRAQTERRVERARVGVMGGRR